MRINCAAVWALRLSLQVAKSCNASQVQAIVVEGQRTVGIRTNDDVLYADNIVLCLGTDPRSTARAAGIKLPTRPVKGYSTTYETHGLNNVPKLPVIDDALHAAVVSLGHRLRVAGTAEFAGHDARLTPSRLDNLRNLLRRIYPHMAPNLNAERAKEWTGLRPMSNDGLPYIGATDVAGLWVNMGHGHLGWTLSVGSAHVLTDLINAQQPDIDAKPFSASR